MGFTADATIQFAAHAFPTTTADPPIDHVNFTYSTPMASWTIACTVNMPTPGATDTYGCSWKIPTAVSPGPITVSFDVYDTAGNVNMAPNGVRQGTISMSASPLTGGSEFGLPIIAPSRTVTVSQGNSMPYPEYDHNPGTFGQYAFDFVVGHDNFDIGAATAGTVIGLNDQSDIQCSGINEEVALILEPLSGCWTHANFVLIADDRDGYATLYMHLLAGSTCSSQFCVHVGDHVALGAPIGRAGSTGFSTGNHLHFQVEAKPTPEVDPYSGWWWTQSVLVPGGFANPTVRMQDINGIPTTGQSFVLPQGTN